MLGVCIKNACFGDRERFKYSHHSQYRHDPARTFTGSPPSAVSVPDHPEQGAGVPRRGVQVAYTICMVLKISRFLNGFRSGLFSTKTT